MEFERATDEVRTEQPRKDRAAANPSRQRIRQAKVDLSAAMVAGAL